MDLRRRVFIVHGHDHAVRETVAEFVTQAGLRPTILQDEPNGGRTIVEKFEDCAAKTDYTIVLITPDDVAFSATDRKNRAFRARQNVILEWGYFLAKLGRRRVCLLYRSGTEIPSDLHGVLYIELDEDGEWRKKILREFQSVGIIPSGKTERRSADDGSPSKRGHGRFCWN